MAQFIAELGSRNTIIDCAQNEEIDMGWRYPTFGPIAVSISGRLKCAEIAASLAAIRVQKGGRTDWRRLWVTYSRIHLHPDIGVAKMRRSRGTHSLY